MRDSLQRLLFWLVVGLLLASAGSSLADVLSGTTPAAHVAGLVQLLTAGMVGLTLLALFRVGPRARTTPGRSDRDLEQRVHDRTAELTTALEALKRSNRELEQFACVAAHDLQEPLRKIQGFGDWLQKHCAAELGEQGRDYLGRIVAAANRMQRLIDDLLAYAGAAQRPPAPGPVNLAEVAREVIANLEARLQQTGGKVILGELPTVQADRLHLSQLLQNLIGNALKFHRSDEPPVVRVEARLLSQQDPPQWEITVQDNGIGFAETHLDRMFQAFQRLPGSQGHEGTGVGLAICRTIVQQQGGTITARSTPGQGSTFIVRWPFWRDEG